MFEVAKPWSHILLSSSTVDSFGVFQPPLTRYMMLTDPGASPTTVYLTETSSSSSQRSAPSVFLCTTRVLTVLISGEDTWDKVIVCSPISKWAVLYGARSRFEEVLTYIEEINERKTTLNEENTLESANVEKSLWVSPPFKGNRRAAGYSSGRWCFFLLTWRRMFPSNCSVLSEKSATPSLSVVRFCSRRGDHILPSSRYTDMSAMGVLL